jgi:CTP synthase
VNDPDVSNYLELPLVFNEQKFTEKIQKALNLPVKKVNLTVWNAYIKKTRETKKKTVTVAIVGKYFTTGEYQLRDAYAALLDALDHAAIFQGVKLNVKFIDAESVEKKGIGKIGKPDGLIVPIGWGARGVEGMIKAIQLARKNKIPYLGLCYGMQLAMVEFARNVLRLKNAHTTEVNPKSSYPVIHLIEAQKEKLARRAYGGTMRLGAWDCRLTPGTSAYVLYKKYGWVKGKDTVISERHRHRYEFNNSFKRQFEKAGIIFSGRAVLEDLVEIIELPKSIHPFFIGTQFHPEYKSRPLLPHPFFIAFLGACTVTSSP